MTGVEGRPLFGDVYRGRRVLVTGHTGFKGSWLSHWLLSMGAEVTGLALAPDTDPALFDELELSSRMDSHLGDVRDAEACARIVREAAPEIVFHLAAQPLVRRSYDEPVYTFETNVMGTVNVLQALRESPSTRSVVCITTDKVYANPETGVPFAEDEPLGGHDPYSASKAAAEIVVASYRSSFFGDSGMPAVSSARAGNVIGGGDWAADRIVPDTVRALSDGAAVAVRNPASVRPWQHVLEPLSGYLWLAARQITHGHEYATAFNFGPDTHESHTVAEVVDRAIKTWGSGSWEQPDLGVQPHEAGLLRLDITRARARLGWEPVWGFERGVDRTIGWYRRLHLDPASAQRATSDDIAAFVADAAAIGQPWA